LAHPARSAYARFLVFSARTGLKVSNGSNSDLASRRTSVPSVESFASRCEQLSGDLRKRLAVVDAVGDHAQRQREGMRPRLGLRVRINEDARRTGASAIQGPSSSRSTSIFSILTFRPVGRILRAVREKIVRLSGDLRNMCSAVMPASAGSATCLPQELDVSSSPGSGR
jgi:hypothetical protein